MILTQAVANSASTLAGVSPTPRVDAEILAMHAFGFSRSDLIARAQQTLTAPQCERLSAWVARRFAGEPIAYIVGRREFWSLDLLVSPATLIPRPETELVVERALTQLPPNSDAVVADLGTGCGAIALAIARECPNARIIATDRCADALALARTNAQRLGAAHVEFRLGDWLVPLADEALDLIVSNPPYLPTALVPELEPEVRTHEPRLALDGGPDGLALIRRIAATARRCLKPSGALALETAGDMQAEAAASALRSVGWGAVAVRADLAGVDRFVAGRA